MALNTVMKRDSDKHSSSTNIEPKKGAAAPLAEASTATTPLFNLL